MICVVDASVAVKWFAHGTWAQQEDDIDPALGLLQASRDGRLTFHQPVHFLVEMAAVLARLAPDSARQHLADLKALDLAWAEPSAALDLAIDMAQRLDHHLFDTLYHALALQNPGAVLVTADRRYHRKARSLGQIAWLPDFRAS